jgi:nicotinamide-nucleotide amidase
MVLEFLLRAHARRGDANTLGMATTTAEAMARGARRLLGADVALAVTGVAGPAEQDGRPVGTVCFGVDIQGEVTSTTVRFPGEREMVRQFAAISLLDALRRRLIGSPLRRA